MTVFLQCFLGCNKRLFSRNLIDGVFKTIISHNQVVMLSAGIEKRHATSQIWVKNGTIDTHSWNIYDQGMRHLTFLLLPVSLTPQQLILETI